MQKIEFIDKSIKKHGILYDYSCVPDRVKAWDDVDIICPIHGSFTQRANHHYQRSGCTKCFQARRTKTKDKFITEALTVHGNVYDYTNIHYINNATKIAINCPVHGEFYQEPWSHLNGHACKKCSMNGRYTESYFIVNKHKKYIDAELYLFSFSNATETFYKIGVTTKGYRSRWKKMKEYTNELIEKWDANLYTVFETEQKMLKTTLIPFLYKPITKAFDGSTECFRCSPLELESIRAEVSSYIAG